MIKNQWVTGRCSTGGCVEVQWRTACVQVGCVQVGHDELRDVVLVRDSKLGDQSPVIEYSPQWWQARCDGMRTMANRTDSYADAWLPSGVHRVHDHYEWRKGGVTLTFTPDEWDAFTEGVNSGTFDL